MHVKKEILSLDLVDELNAKAHFVILLSFALFTVFVILIVYFGNQPNKYWSYLVTTIWLTVCLYGLYKRENRERAIIFIFWVSTFLFPILVYFKGLIALPYLPTFIVLIMLFAKGRQKHYLIITALSLPVILPLFQSVPNPEIWYRLTGISIFLYLVLYFSLKALEKTWLVANENTNKLLELTSKQEKIFATIGHELRTPAASIDMLIDEDLLQHSSKNINELKILSTHMLSILDDMKSVANSDYTAEKIVTSKELSVFETLTRSISGVTNLAESKNFHIELRGSKVTRLGHYGVAKNIQQVVQNLLKNSIIHSEGTDAVVELEYEDLPDGYTGFKITISDNGKGIDPSYRDKMFDAFERGETKAEGTGLGLHICRELAQLMPNGDLTYSDNPRGGAIFEFCFTLIKIESEPLVNQEEVTKTSLIAGKRILLVEDTNMLRMLGLNVLRRAGAEVIAVEDGLQALATLKTFDADVVLTDIMMPNMNGYELTEALRKQGFSKPIIGVTGATVGMEAKRLIESGANRVLAKPLTKEGVESVLSSLQNKP